MTANIHLLSGMSLASLYSFSLPHKINYDVGVICVFSGEKLDKEAQEDDNEFVEERGV